ncbi:MAG: hypothetical protein JXQ85_13710 [Cognatishimia sp.]|uniref:hypothetical protein n=1 Tax=Cognatishimia sp. TaxID=2211648 RepID=UPI003B8C8105
MRIGLTLGFLLAATFAQADEAKQAKQDQCDALGAIVTQLVELRQDGKREKRAIKTLTQGKYAVEERYQPTVQFLSGWVYSLTEQELTFEPGKKYAEACVDH